MDLLMQNSTSDSLFELKLFLFVFLPEFVPVFHSPREPDPCIWWEQWTVPPPSYASICQKNLPATAVVARFVSVYIKLPTLLGTSTSECIEQWARNEAEIHGDSS